MPRSAGAPRPRRSRRPPRSAPPRSCSGRSRAGCSTAPRASLRPIARSTWLGRPEPLAQAEPAEKAMSRSVGHQPRDVEPVAADVEIAAIALLDRAVDRPVRAEPRDRGAPQRRRHARRPPLRVAHQAGGGAEAGAQSAGEACPIARRLLRAAVRAAASSVTPSRIHSAPMPFGPWTLCAEIATRSHAVGNRHAAIALHRVAQHQRARRVRDRRRARRPAGSRRSRC